ncbi:hypothetical protein K439DRAFT_270569 [Ramaria rubella]|nr:hypothetical protein K439DRAFT_270569 [Ramaria rubella]
MILNEATANFSFWKFGWVSAGLNWGGFVLVFWKLLARVCTVLQVCEVVQDDKIPVSCEARLRSTSPDSW